MEKLPEDNTLLPKYNTKLSPEQLTRVIKDGYKVAAFHGSLNAMNRVAEAYFYGIGVEQSDEQVSIWSKVIENIYPILHQSAINNNNTNIQKLSFDKTNYIRILLNNPQ